MPRRSPFPPVSIDEALVIARAILEHNAGKPMRRITIFDTLGRQPESGSSRSLITASAGYGVIEGNYKSDLIKLTELGRSIVEKDDVSAKLSAVLSVEIFRLFYERYQNAVIPNQNAALDYLKTQGIPETSASNCLEVLLANARQVGLVHEISGKERIVAPQHALERLSNSGKGISGQSEQMNAVNPPEPATVPAPSISGFTPAQTGQLPPLHIDIQIHISADSRPEQIEQIFASMAKHLYNKGE